MILETILYTVVSFLLRDALQQPVKRLPAPPKPVSAHVVQFDRAGAGG